MKQISKRLIKSRWLFTPWNCLFYCDERAGTPLSRGPFQRIQLTDDGFRGVVLVRARTFQEALLISQVLQLSPGGDVEGCSFRDPDFTPPEHFKNRLLDKAELQGETELPGWLLELI